MYATDCNFQNIIRNEEKINKQNLKAWGFISFSNLCLYLCNKNKRMTTAKFHHGHHGRFQSQGRL